VINFLVCFRNVAILLTDRVAWRSLVKRCHSKCRLVSVLRLEVSLKSTPATNDVHRFICTASSRAGRIEFSSWCAECSDSSHLLIVFVLDMFCPFGLASSCGVCASHSGVALRSRWNVGLGIALAVVGIGIVRSAASSVGQLASRAAISVGQLASILRSLWYRIVFLLLGSSSTRRDSFLYRARESGQPFNYQY
jgi:hypothetical protein